MNCVLKIEPVSSPEKGTQQGLFSINKDSIIQSAVAELVNIPSEYTKKSGFISYVKGLNVTAYKYRLNNQNWSEEFSIDNPIVLQSLEDGSYTLFVIGKNQSQYWQKEATKYNWIVDTVVEPPELKLAAESDTGAFNSDNITKLKEINISGSCENGSEIIFLDNEKPLDYNNIEFLNNEFSASFDLTEADHNIIAFQTDLAGNISLTSNILDIKIDSSVDDFSIDITDIIDGNSCTWALEPENITITGTRESGAVISVDNDQTNQIYISYSDDTTWAAELIDMPTGQYTVLIHATDIAGNTSTIKKTIYRNYPHEVSIETIVDNLTADGNSSLPITISFYTNDKQELCLNPNVKMNTSMGSIINESFSTSTNKIYAGVCTS